MCDDQKGIKFHDTEKMKWCDEQGSPIPCLAIANFIASFDCLIKNWHSFRKTTSKVLYPSSASHCWTIYQIKTISLSDKSDSNDCSYANIVFATKTTTNKVAVYISTYLVNPWEFLMDGIERMGRIRNDWEHDDITSTSRFSSKQFEIRLSFSLPSCDPPSNVTWPIQSIHDTTWNPLLTSASLPQFYILSE